MGNFRWYCGTGESLPILGFFAPKFQANAKPWQSSWKGCRVPQPMHPVSEASVVKSLTCIFRLFLSPYSPYSDIAETTPILPNNARCEFVLRGFSDAQSADGYYAAFAYYICLPYTPSSLSFLIATSEIIHTTSSLKSVSGPLSMFMMSC